MVLVRNGQQMLSLDRLRCVQFTETILHFWVLEFSFLKLSCAVFCEEAVYFYKMNNGCKKTLCMNSDEINTHRERQIKCVFLHLQMGKVMAWSFFPLSSFLSARASTTSCLASKRFTPLKDMRRQKMITTALMKIHQAYLFHHGWGLYKVQYGCFVDCNQI